MVTVMRWTGLEARCLRLALRMSVRRYAEHLGVAQRTVSNWESQLSETSPTTEMQQALDTALSRAPEDVRERFAELLQDAPSQQQPGALEHWEQDPPARRETSLDFETEHASVLDALDRLWTTDLLHQGPARNDTIGAADVMGAMGRWLVTPPAPSAGTQQSPSGARVGASDVATVHASVRMFEQLDHQFGGGHVRLAAVQYLHSSLGPLLRGRYTDTVRRQLFAVATEATYKTGAMAYDIGRHDDARRYFVQALNLAHAAGDRALGGKALALMSHQANFRGEVREAVDLARAAGLGANQQAPARVQAMYAAMQARALASLGDGPGCRYALGVMERAFARTGTVEDDPDWIGYFNRAEYHNELAHCLAALGEPDHAARELQLAVDEAGDQFPRSQTFCRLAVATAYLQPRRGHHRDVEQACTLAGDSLGDVTKLESHRVATYLDTFTSTLERDDTSGAATRFRQRLAHSVNE